MSTHSLNDLSDDELMFALQRAKDKARSVGKLKGTSTTRVKIPNYLYDQLSGLHAERRKRGLPA